MTSNYVYGLVDAGDGGGRLERGVTTALGHAR